MHRVFITYHHENDQSYKDALVSFGDQNRIFIDWSVDTGDISDDLSDQRIREIIRDEYLRDSTVTIVLVGAETKRRKHVDWGIYSSMYDGRVNKKSGIIAIMLPTQCSGNEEIYAPHGEQESLYSDITTWTSINSRAEHERRYPNIPDRLIDNLLYSEAKVSVIPWQRLSVTTLATLIDLAFRDRSLCKYDLSRPMRRANS